MPFAPRQKATYALEQGVEQRLPRTLRRGAGNDVTLERLRPQQQKWGQNVLNDPHHIFHTSVVENNSANLRVAMEKAKQLPN